MFLLEILPSDQFLCTNLWTFLCRGTKAIQNVQIPEQEVTHHEIYFLLAESTWDGVHFLHFVWLVSIHLQNGCHRFSLSCPWAAEVSSLPVFIWLGPIFTLLHQGKAILAWCNFLKEVEGVTALLWLWLPKLSNLWLGKKFRNAEPQQSPEGVLG